MIVQYENLISISLALSLNEFAFRLLLGLERGTVIYIKIAVV